MHWQPERERASPSALASIRASVICPDRYGTLAENLAFACSRRPTEPSPSRSIVAEPAC